MWYWLVLRMRLRIFCVVWVVVLCLLCFGVLVVGFGCLGFAVGEGLAGGFEGVLGGVEEEVAGGGGGGGGGFVDGVPVAGCEGVEVGGFLGVEWG